MPSRLYDLTIPVRVGMSNYPGDPRVESDIVADYSQAGYRLSRWRLGSHTGTHIDAPSHFLPGGLTVDKLDNQILTGPANVADALHRGSREEIAADDLEMFLPCERLLICTGWDRLYGTKGYFTDVPGLSARAVDAIIASNVRLVGIDAPNIHASEWESIHRRLLGAGIVIVEGLTGLVPLVGQQVNLVVAPLLLVGADGAPARVFAFSGTTIDHD